MKKVAIIAGLALIILGAYFVWNKNNNAERVTNGALVNQSMLRSTVYQEFGTVTVFDGERVTELNDTLREVQVSSGAKIVTGTKSYAYVIFPDNSMMSLDANTEVIIDVTEGNTSIAQMLGNTYHRVKKLQTDESYEVKTPGTLAAVRGTKFAVEIDSNTKKSSVKVTENVVQVYKLLETEDFMKVTTQTMDENSPSVMVPVDTKVEVPFVGLLPAQPVVITMQERNDGAWMEKNEKINTFFDSMDGDGVRVIEKMREKRQEAREQAKTEGDIERVFMDRLRTLKQNTAPNSVTPSTVKVEEKAPVPLVPTAPVVQEVAKDIIKISQVEFESKFEDVYAKLFPVSASVDKRQFCASMANVTATQVRNAVTALETTHGEQVPNKENLLALLDQAKKFCASSDSSMEIIEEAYTEKYPF